MTKTDAATEAPEEAPVPIAWIGPSPLFLVTQENEDTIVDAVSEIGYSVFFLLGESKDKKTHKDKKNQTFTTVSYSPRIFKVVNNLVGSAITEMDKATLGLGDVNEIAYFTLPSIPYSLINDVDDFFREVHRVHKTEAIVLFTYDPSYKESEDPSEGWGVLVPKQENSAVSCDYDPTSVVEIKPDDVYIVGSAHSHPGMAAYCSGTDKADQAEFDGIHITFGWKTGSMNTEYHIELQMGGGAFTMKPEDVFTDLPEPIENDRIEEWTKNVTKKSFTTQAGMYGGAWDDWTGYRGAKKDDKNYNLPKDCPSPHEVTLVVHSLLKAEDLKDCPVCNVSLIPAEKESHRCKNCQTFLLHDGLSFEAMIADRLKQNQDVNMLLPEKDPYKSIWVWEENFDEKNHIIDTIYELHQGRADKQTTSSAGKAEGGADTFGLANADDSNVQCPSCGEINSVLDDDYCWKCYTDLSLAFILKYEKDLEDFDGFPDPEAGGYTNTALDTGWRLCCNSKKDECNCEEHDVLTFAEADEILMDADLLVYKEGGGCDDCLLLFRAACPSYREFLIDWYNSTKSEEEIGLITKCGEYIDGRTTDLQQRSAE